MRASVSQQHPNSVLTFLIYQAGWNSETCSQYSLICSNVCKVEHTLFVCLSAILLKLLYLNDLNDDKLLLNTESTS